MIKRIISYKVNEEGKNIITNISSPIDELHITKTQLSIIRDNYTFINDENYIEPKIENFPDKKAILIWDEEIRQIIVEYQDITFDDMTLEKKVEYLQNQLIQQTQQA